MQDVIKTTMLAAVTLVTTRAWGDVIQESVADVLQRACCSGRGFDEEEMKECIEKQDLRGSMVVAISLTFVLIVFTSMSSML